jgi:predicted TIM-barrel fold metal-dependent hydrolase
VAGNRHGPPEVSAESVLAQLDEAAVAGAVLVPPSFEGYRNDLALDACRRHPRRFKVFGVFALDHPGAPDLVLSAMQDPDMLGLRLPFNVHNQDWLKDGTIGWLWPLAEAQGIPISMFPGGRLDLVAVIARSYPRLRISVDHLGIDARANPSAKEVMRLITALKPLARCDNVALKASGLPCALSQAYSIATLRGILDDLLAWFGPRRVFWGSDLTRCSHDTYRQTLETFVAAAGNNSDEVVRQLMGAALREWIGWGQDANSEGQSVSPEEEQPSVVGTTREKP